MPDPQTYPIKVDFEDVTSCNECGDSHEDGDGEVWFIGPATTQCLSCYEDEHEEPDTSCPTCQGTGIGQHGDPDTSKCRHCGGTGEAKHADS